MDPQSERVVVYERTVFINCPFDDGYLPLLRAMVWTLDHLGFTPRLALERSDAGEGRLSKIRTLIESSKYGIHDLSRLRASKKGEFYRLNMPFELGIDYTLKHYSAESRHHEKVLLILESEPYSAQKALSDIAFTDPQAHEEDPELLIEKLRTWLVINGESIEESATGLWDAYNDYYGELTVYLGERG